MAKHKKVRKIGIYVRLSKEDSRSGESVSIENQKLMLMNYVQEKKWDLKEVYQDDGFSGTNQNRPAFQRMMADVKSGYINTILIKDLSRLGRNYLEVGNLAEVFLPEHGCELISLNEKLDDMMVFRNWFNEQHSKSTSAKVRIGKRASAQNGRHTGAYAPYGYRKEPQNRHVLLVDEATAPVVRNIFKMRAQGMSSRGIVAKLNEDGILPPREYYYQQRGGKNPKKTTGLWSDSTIKDILKNEAYLGTKVSGKSGTISYKNQKQVRKDSDEWVRVENSHPPLVDAATWDKVQKLFEKNYRPRIRKDGIANLFTGLLFCDKCGMRLRGQVERRTRKDGSLYSNVSYMCSTFGRSGKNACTSHCIGEKTLIELAVEHIRTNAAKVALDEERMINAILEYQSNDGYPYKGAYESELAVHRQQIEKLDMFIENLYADKLSGVVPESLFKRQVLKYEKERGERSKSVKVLEKRLAKVKPVSGNAATWFRLMKQYADIDSLTLCNQTVFELVDKIIVGETRGVDGQRVCDLKIFFNFSGDVDGASARDIIPNGVFL